MGGRDKPVHAIYGLTLLIPQQPPGAARLPRTRDHQGGAGAESPKRSDSTQRFATAMGTENEARREETVNQIRTRRHAAG